MPASTRVQSPRGTPDSVVDQGHRCRGYDATDCISIILIFWCYCCQPCCCCCCCCFFFLPGMAPSSLLLWSSNDGWMFLSSLSSARLNFDADTRQRRYWIDHCNALLTILPNCWGLYGLNCRDPVSCYLITFLRKLGLYENLERLKSNVLIVGNYMCVTVTVRVPMCSLHDPIACRKSRLSRIVAIYVVTMQMYTCSFLWNPSRKSHAVLILFYLSDIHQATPLIPLKQRWTFHMCNVHSEGPAQMLRPATVGAT